MSPSDLSRTHSASNSENALLFNSLPDVSTQTDPIARLDGLLETYLDRLDAYQSLREQLSKNLSAGFLSLAHANRTGNLGSGRRYGEEGYDERMKAGKRVEIQMEGEAAETEASGKAAETRSSQRTESPSMKYTYSIQRHAPAAKIFSKKDEAQRYSPPDRPRIDSDCTIADALASSISQETSQKSWTEKLLPHPHQENATSTLKPAKSLDPLNWYGLLVPPSLRTVQASFSSAVENQISQLLNVQREMAKLEALVRQAREEAGLATGDGRHTNSETEEPADASLPTVLPSSHQEVDRPSNGPGGTSLSARPKEPPRPRVLKLGS